jgi:hypothetical protein
MVSVRLQAAQSADFQREELKLSEVKMLSHLPQCLETRPMRHSRPMGLI